MHDVVPSHCLGRDNPLTTNRIDRACHDATAPEPAPETGPPWGQLPALCPERLSRLQRLQKDMEEAFGGEHVEPWDVRKVELEEVFLPNNCACTYGELDHFSVAQLLQEASLSSGHRFVDVGSGLGKLVLAAACVTDVQCCGVEISWRDPIRKLLGEWKIQQ
eukprot:Skav215295  [mRNA]  locus=scaffold6542:8424:11753:+ [translate_table: standard]